MPSLCCRSTLRLWGACSSRLPPQQLAVGCCVCASSKAVPAASAPERSELQAAAAAAKIRCLQQLLLLRRRRRMQQRSPYPHIKHSLRRIHALLLPLSPLLLRCRRVRLLLRWLRLCWHRLPRALWSIL